ncbi:MAG TPA: hypothetical protein VLW53_14905, partial [Candidatus Eisenbacteria bacterium]|nr:hypothetical protein [Candidatus Eisenbacteria bacterium]
MQDVDLRSVSRAVRAPGGPDESGFEGCGPRESGWPAAPVALVAVRVRPVASAWRAAVQDGRPGAVVAPLVVAPPVVEPLALSPPSVAPAAVAPPLVAPPVVEPP